jgi:hypothetical protein
MVVLGDVERHGDGDGSRTTRSGAWRRKRASLGSGEHRRSAGDEHLRGEKTVIVERPSQRGTRGEERLWRCVASP